MGSSERDEDSIELITDHKEMCQILKNQYTSSYSKHREEKVLGTVENQGNEDLTLINDIKFTEKIPHGSLKGFEDKFQFRL